MVSIIFLELCETFYQIFKLEGSCEKTPALGAKLDKSG